MMNDTTKRYNGKPLINLIDESLFSDEKFDGEEFNLAIEFIKQYGDKLSPSQKVLVVRFLKAIEDFGIQLASGRIDETQQITYAQICDAKINNTETILGIYMCPKDQFMRQIYGKHPIS